MYGARTRRAACTVQMYTCNRRPLPSYRAGCSRATETAATELAVAESGVELESVVVLAVITENKFNQFLASELICAIVLISSHLDSQILDWCSRVRPWASENSWSRVIND